MKLLIKKAAFLWRLAHQWCVLVSEKLLVHVLYAPILSKGLMSFRWYYILILTILYFSLGIETLEILFGFICWIHFSLGIEMLEIPFLNKIHTLAMLPIRVSENTGVLI